MGHAIEALPKGVKNVQRNPMLFLIGFGVLLAMVPLLIVGGIIAIIAAFVPVVGQLIARLVVAVPLKTLLLGGMVGAAGAGFAGSVSFGDYTSAVRDNFASLAGAFALYEVVLFVFGIGFGIVFFFVFGLGSALMAPTGDSTAAMAGLGFGMIAVAIAAVVLIFLYAVVFQFLDVAVVLGGKDATGAFKESWRLTREAPLSVLGYTVMRGLIGGVILLPGYFVALVGGHFSDVLTLVGVAVVVLLYPIAFTVLMSYHAAYYGVRLQAS